MYVYVYCARTRAYIGLYIYICVCVYIYTQREREREMHICIMHIYAAALLSHSYSILTAPNAVGMEGPKLKDSGADGEAMEGVAEVI